MWLDPRLSWDECIETYCPFFLSICWPVVWGLQFLLNFLIYSWRGWNLVLLFTFSIYWFIRFSFRSLLWVLNCCFCSLWAIFIERCYFYWERWFIQFFSTSSYLFDCIPGLICPEWLWQWLVKIICCLFITQFIFFIFLILVLAIQLGFICPLDRFRVCGP